MENLIPFKFEETNIRTLTKEDGSVWFTAKDISSVLGIGNSSDAISRLRGKDKGVVSTDTLGGSQEMAIVSEFGLYELVLSSRKENAQKFKYWICDEVIPSIRKTGSYSIKQTKALSPYELIKQQLRQRMEEQIRQWEALEEMDKRVRNQESEISGLKMDLYKRDGYFCVAGYLKRLGQNCDTKTAAKHGRKLSSICKKFEKEIHKIDHPAFGMVNTYPEEILDEYFGTAKVPLNSRMLSDGLCDQVGFD